MSQLNMYISSNPRANEHIVITNDIGKDTLIHVNIFLNTLVQALAVLRRAVSKQPH